MQNLCLPSISDYTESGGHAVSTESGARAVSTVLIEMKWLKMIVLMKEVTVPLLLQSSNAVPECYDLARYAGTTIYLSDADKYELLANPFRLGADYKFQKSATERALSFQYRCKSLVSIVSEKTVQLRCTVASLHGCMVVGFTIDVHHAYAVVE